jgi:hypothetical protein
MKYKDDTSLVFFFLIVCFPSFKSMLFVFRWKHPLTPFGFQFVLWTYTRFGFIFGLTSECLVGCFDKYIPTLSRILAAFFLTATFRNRGGREEVWSWSSSTWSIKDSLEICRGWISTRYKLHHFQKKNMSRRNLVKSLPKNTHNSIYRTYGHQKHYLFIRTTRCARCV